MYLGKLRKLTDLSVLTNTDRLKKWGQQGPVRYQASYVTKRDKGGSDLRAAPCINKVRTENMLVVEQIWLADWKKSE